MYADLVIVHLIFQLIALLVGLSREIVSDLLHSLIEALFDSAYLIWDLDFHHAVDFTVKGIHFTCQSAQLWFMTVKDLLKLWLESANSFFNLFWVWPRSLYLKGS